MGMIFTDENRTLTICQATEHAMLVPWGRFSRCLKLSERLRAAVAPRCHQDAVPGGDLILEFGLASLDTIGVHPNWQGQGLAIELMNEFVRNLGKAGVERIYTLVNWNDWDLMRFFEKSGFVPGKMVNLEMQLTS
jgi:ribosomal protein S18 acetylase RimI-like enzyme